MWHRHFLSAIILALALPQTIASINVEKYHGETTGGHIITLKPHVDLSSFLNLEGTNLNGTVTHRYSVINAFAGNLDNEVIDFLCAHRDVASISEDGMYHGSGTVMTTETNAPWGIARLASTTKLANQNPNVLDFTYTYTNETAGFGVDIYIVDTGVYIQHTQFSGRATWGATFGPYPSADGLGHGTHCAGTAAGVQVGVAKAASIIAVKVLDDNNSGTISDIISGLDYVVKSVSNSQRPSVVSMSLDGAPSTALDNAVASVTNSSIHVVVAAGNGNVDASTISPARSPNAITVGASNIADARSSFSNFGAAVDVFAPGEDVISSWIGNPDALEILSGTSMSTPHITGLVAALISRDGNVAPAAMSAKVKQLALKNALSLIPANTVNDLAHLGNSTDDA